MKNLGGQGNEKNMRLAVGNHSAYSTFLGLGDLMKLVVQDVVCEGRKIPTVIDTSHGTSQHLLTRHINPWKPPQSLLGS